MGIPLDLVVDKSPMLDDLTCPICTDLLDCRSCVQTACNHLYCLSCLTQAMRDRRTCPSCEAYLQTPLNQIHLNNIPLYRILGKVRVRCELHTLGCNWVGEASNVGGHAASCRFIRSTCPTCNEAYLPDKGCAVCLRKRVEELEAASRSAGPAPYNPSMPTSADTAYTLARLLMPDPRTPALYGAMRNKVYEGICKVARHLATVYEDNRGAVPAGSCDDKFARAALLALSAARASSAQFTANQNNQIESLWNSCASAMGLRDTDDMQELFSYMDRDAMYAGGYY